jgi:hypothetical protein
MKMEWNVQKIEFHNEMNLNAATDTAFKYCQ